MTADCGYDGNPPKFLPVRDLAGKGKRKLAGVYNANTDRLGWLEARRRISPTQLAAGRRLQHDWQQSQVGDYCALSGATMVRGGHHGSWLPDAKLDAQARHGAAMRLLGHSGRVIVDRVVLQNIPMATAEAIMGLPEGGGIGALTVALDTLAAHYGMG